MKSLTLKEYTDSILDVEEVAMITSFISNEKMFESVRKALLAGLYSQGTLKKGEKAESLTNFALGMVSNRQDLSNDQLGADLRACWQGMNMLEMSLDNLTKYKKQEKPKEKTNDAR